jgi:acetone carboxylase, beta subunit
MPVEPGADEDQKAGLGIYIDGGWQMLRERVVEEFAKSGIGEDEIRFKNYVRMQYMGQLNDLEIYSPHQELGEGSQVDDLIAAFEEAYGKLYARSARSPELGYLVTNVIVTGSVEVEKPALPDEEEGGGPLVPKDVRPVWWRDGWIETPIYEQDGVRAGHAVYGPAIVESPADTFAIPPDRTARLDGNRIWHLTTDN